MAEALERGKGWPLARTALPRTKLSFHGIVAALKPEGVGGYGASWLLSS